MPRGDIIEPDPERDGRRHTRGRTAILDCFLGLRFAGGSGLTGLARRIGECK